MTGKITKIHPLKASRFEAGFIRVEFEMEDGTWAKTDIVTKYRNYKVWRPILEKGEGTGLIGLRFRSPAEIDADSRVSVEEPPVERVTVAGALAGMPEKMKEELRRKLHGK